VPVLVVEGVYQGLTRGKSWTPVLDGVSFDVERGEVVAIIGGRLSGKSQLLGIAAGIVRPEAGSVRLGEFELTTMSVRKREYLRGRDHQIVWLDRRGMDQKLLVSKMVGWSVAYRRGGKDTDRQVAAMLERVGVPDCAHKRWPELSPWQQVRVGLARAFVARPRLVVVDDLLDGLGSPATTEVSRLLRSLIAEAAPLCGVLMSVSDRDSAMFADRVWSLSRGKLTPTRGQQEADADVVPLRQRDKGGGSRRVG
jgi:ABC-type multidrug transport system ATPase subunit